MTLSLFNIIIPKLVGQTIREEKKGKRKVKFNTITKNKFMIYSDSTPWAPM